MAVYIPLEGINENCSHSLLGVQGRKAVLEKYSMSDMAKNIIKVYESIINN